MNFSSHFSFIFLTLFSSLACMQDNLLIFFYYSLFHISSFIFMYGLILSYFLNWISFFSRFFFFFFYFIDIYQINVSQGPDP